MNGGQKGQAEGEVQENKDLLGNCCISGPGHPLAHSFIQKELLNN